jgi:Uncharacterised ArCR, COG2043
MPTQFDAERLAWLSDRLGLPEPPLAVFYTDTRPESGFTPCDDRQACIFAHLRRLRKHGGAAFFDADHSSCGGAAFFLGFADPWPGQPYFVSTGIPGQMEGERYIKTPELAMRFNEETRPLPAAGKYCVFRRVGDLDEGEAAEVVLFFAPPDVMAGLMGLVSFATESFEAVHAPMSSGCGAAVAWARREAQRDNPKAILGGFDPSVRPFLDPDTLILSMPAQVLQAMLRDAQESFLTAHAWSLLRRRIR